MVAPTQTLMYNKLAESGLTKKDQQALNIKFLTAKKTKELIDEEVVSMQILYHDIDGKVIKDFWRLRRLEIKTKSTFVKKKARRYSQPSNTSPRFYMPPLPIPFGNTTTTWKEIATNTEIQLIFTEGELKAACACKFGFPTISIGGVYAFRSKKKKKPLIDDFYLFNWEQRVVSLIFDSDLATNIDVQKALQALARELTTLGALVYIGYLPDVEELEGKTGLDDFLVACGPEELHEVLQEAEPYTESLELWKLNEEVAYIKELGEVVELETGLRMKPNNFKEHAYSNRRYKLYAGDKLQEKSTAAEWLKWPHRHALKGITYAPNQDSVVDNSLFNTWRSWGCEAKKGTMGPWHKLMRGIFGANTAERQWFERWLAYQVQNPGVKLTTAVLMWGVNQGTGKSFIGYIMRNIFGRENFSEIGNSHLISDFNHWQIEKQFVMVDEVKDVSGHFKQIGERLKQLITQEEIFVNKKYLANYYIPDSVNYYLTSNSPNALPLEDKDRRYFIWEVQESLEEEWFIDVLDPWAKGDGPSALRYYLEQINLGKFTAKTKAPMTVAKNDMIYISKSHLGAWVNDLLHEPDAILEHVESDLLTNQQLLTLFDPDEKTKTTNNALGRELTKAGFVRQNVRVGKKTEGLYAVRNKKKWENAKATQLVAHYLDHFPLIEEEHTRGTRRVSRQGPKKLKPRKF